MQSPYSFVADIPQSLYKSHLNILTNNNIQTNCRRVSGLYQEQEYFEIEICTDDNIPLEKTMDDILNLNKYKCHICNIEVPKTYSKEHNSSAKHITCNEIANIALERTKLQMQSDIPVSRKLDISDTYFCESCSVIVLNSEKDKHVTTKAHKISFKHDEMLNSLLQIYTDIENVDVKSEIDELELLRQNIELESMQTDSDSAEIESVDAEKEILDLNVIREEVNIIKTEIKTALASELKSVADEVSEFRELMDKMKEETVKLQEKSDALLVRVDECGHNQLETLQQAMPTKNTRTSRASLSKKYHIRKLKERFQNKTAPVDVEDDKSPEKNKAPLKNSLSAVVKEQPTVPLDAISQKIDAIMAKYFDNNCTVDALNKTIRKTSKDCNKKRDGKEKHTDIENKEQIQNNNSKKQSLSEEREEQKKEHIEQKDKTDKNNDNNTITEQNNNTNTEQNKNNHNTENNHIINNKNDTEDMHNIKKPKNTKKPRNNKIKAIKERKITEPTKSRTPSFNLVYFLKDITRRCETKPIHSVEALTDTIVQITAINGDKFKVSVNNFHSFDVKAQETYCKVCESPSVRRPEWHIIENEHRDKIMIPIIDRNGIRQLDDIWSHCILCNDLTKNVEFHLQSLLHKNKLKHCLVELGKHYNEVSNDAYEEETLPTSPDDQSGALTELLSKHNLVITSKTNLNCVICDVIINYDVTSIQQHASSFDHLNNYEIEQNCNNLVDVDADRFYCIACDVNFEKSLMFNHCNGRKHKKLLQTSKPNLEANNQIDNDEIVLSSISQSVKKSKGTIEDSELICFVCNLIIHNVDEHMNSFEHKKSYYSYLEANKLNEIEPDTFYCIPCNTVITIDYLMSHCTSRKHRVVMKNGETSKTIEREEKKEANNKNELERDRIKFQSPASKVDKTMPLKVLYQFREMTDSRKLLCTVCDEEVIYDRKNAMYHVSTLDHIVAFNLMMLWNKIKKRSDKYYCDICRNDMTYFSEITHVLGKHHVDNLAKQPKGTVYEYDRTLVTHAYAMSHSVGDRRRPSSIISVRPDKLM